VYAHIFAPHFDYSGLRIRCQLKILPDTNTKGIHPNVPCHHIREYRYAYGAVEPLTGESFSLVLPYTNTDCTNIFLNQLSKKYQEDHVLLVCDGASWHKSKKSIFLQMFSCCFSHLIRQK
jgi:hypothetical protein